MHRIILCITIVVMFAGCSDNADVAARKDAYSDKPKTKEDSLYHDVMEGHDVGMAKIGKVKKYSAQVQQTLDSLNKKGSDQTVIAAFQSVQKDLHNADSTMYQWMEAFKPDSATGDPDLRISYLQSEKEKVTKVKDAILGSLQRADSLFAAGK